jgi:hypothetical protein
MGLPFLPLQGMKKDPGQPFLTGIVEMMALSVISHQMAS